MRHQNSVFHSLTKHIPWTKFDQIVEKHGADELVRKLTTKRQFIALLGGAAMGWPLTDPNNPNSATEFYITVDGKTPALFDPQSGLPDIVAKHGTVEDWIIENRSNELHAFHIHQLHFLLLDYLGKPVSEPFLRDTVNVPYYKDRMLAYPSIKLRMDFRDPSTVGTFVYHCHMLEHEDGGMMGLIRVEPAVLNSRQ